MRSKTLSSLLAVALATPILIAASGGINSPLRVQPESKLWVEGTSTVRSYSCAAKEFTASIQTNSAQPVAAVIAGEKAVSTVSVEVPVASLDCANGQMNDHMRKALNASNAPVIRYQLTSYELAQAGESVTVTLNGKLTLGGNERPVTMTAEATQGANGTLKVAGSHPVLLSEFGLKAPSLMMGTLKVSDRAVVKYDLTLRP